MEGVTAVVTVKFSHYRSKINWQSRKKKTVSKSCEANSVFNFVDFRIFNNLNCSNEHKNIKFIRSQYKTEKK